MKWIILPVLFFYSFSASAQDEDASLFRAGIVAGFNASQLDGDMFRGYSKLGAHIGLKVKYPIASKPKLSLGTEMLFAMKGSSEDLNFSSSNNTQVKIKLNYVEIPVWISYREWKVDFTGGFSYSRLIGASTSILTTGYLEEDFSKNDLAVILGATYEFNNHWGATFRYNRSFVNSVRKEANKNALVSHLITFRLEYLF